MKKQFSKRKKHSPYPRGKCLRMVLSFLMLLGNSWPGLLFSGSLRFALPVFAASLLFSARRSYARVVNRNPGRVIDLSKFDLSDDPTDTDLLAVKCFAEPIVPTSAPPIAGENAALAKALKNTMSDSADESLSHLHNFTVQFPSSRWVLAVEVDRGVALYHQGYFSKALEAFESAWEAGKDEKRMPVSTTSGKAKLLADRALAEMMRMNCRVGRKDEVKNLLELMKGRRPQGISARYYEDAKDAYWVMTHKPGKAFFCGVYALKSILEFQHSKKAGDPLFLSAESTDKGFSLDEVYGFSKQLGMGLQMAKRSPGAMVIVPSVVNWKLNHYAALLEQKPVPGALTSLSARTLIHSKDPTFGNDTWLSEKALDDESTGYFLVPDGPLPDGWQPVGVEEASKVFGKGFVTGSGPAPPCGGPSAGGGGSSGGPEPPVPGCGSRGMPIADMDLNLVASTMSDTPLSYKPAIGAKMDFTLSYHSKTPTSGETVGSNFGPNWSFNWNGTLFVSNGSYYLYPPGGGEEQFFIPAAVGSAPSTISYTQFTHSLISVNPNGIGFTRQLPDGSMEIYSLEVVAPNLGTYYLLTQVIDSKGNATNLQYNGLLISSIIDPLGRTTSFNYDGSTNQISQITDPFGRSAVFTYDSYGNLSSVTDQDQMTSSFTYNSPLSSDWVTTMTTPYGSTNFDYTGSDNNGDHYLTITDPLGEKEEAIFTQPQTPSDGDNPPVPNGLLPLQQGANPEDPYNEDRNTFFWNKKAMADDPLDPASAKVYHWLHSPEDAQGNLLESIKNPLESRIWYVYPGQQYQIYMSSDGMFAIPSLVARLMTNGSTQSYQYSYTPTGKVLQYTDPNGRQFTKSYDPSYINLLRVQDGNGDLLAGYSYNNQFEPLTYTDQAGQIWNYSYNSAGQLQSVTSPKGEVTSYNYDVNGNLTSVVPPQPGAGVTFTYDNIGRVRSRSNTANGTLTYQYDNLDRVTKVTYPDGTFEQYSYTNLDITNYRDRQGRVTLYAYDADRHMTSKTDPKQQTTSYTWCSCGSLTGITDPKGNKTTFTRDFEGRVTVKQYPDGSKYNYTYGATYNEMVAITDPNQQVAQYSYNLDDSLSGVSYFNVKAQTPNVTLQYDPVIQRLTEMKDGTGTNEYSYFPFGSIGGGKLSTVSQPVGSASANITYTYDADGRMINRSIDGTPENYTYTNARLTNVTNPLGSFGYGYDTAGRLNQVEYPNGQVTNINFFAPNNPLGCTGSIESINNLGAGGTNGQTLSSFNYTYNPTGEIKTWEQQLDNNPSDGKTYGMGYDTDSELQGVTLTEGVSGFDGLTVNQSVTYGYDAAGNRTNETTPVHSNNFGTNELNQLTSITPKPLNVSGATNRAASVTVNGDEVTENNSFSYATTLAPASGVSTPLTVTEVSTDGTINTINSSIPNTQPYSYDTNGNLTADNKYTYQWDAQNRLVQVNTLNAQPATVASTIVMTYDGFGRMASIIEMNGSVTLTAKTFVWFGPQLCQQRDVTGHTITNQFFAFGEIINGTIYFYAKDHLGNIREMTDSSGVVHASYDYDPFGRQTKLSGDLDADFGYTGMYVERTVNLDLTLFRAYDPDKGRWLSRDPGGDFTGPNLYAYVSNNSLRWTDFLGLCGGGGNSNMPPLEYPGGGGGAPVAIVNPNNLDNPIPVPGSPDNEWVPGTPSGTGDLNDVWKPKTSIPGQSQPRLSQRPPEGDNPGYFKSSDGLGNNQHYDMNGNPIPPDEAHPNDPPNVPWWSLPLDALSALGDALIRFPVFIPTGGSCSANKNST